MVAMTKIVATDNNTRGLCLVIHEMPLCIHGAGWAHNQCEAMSKLTSTNHRYIQWNAAISNL